MEEKSRDLDCTCKWNPVKGRIWCEHCIELENAQTDNEEMSGRFSDDVFDD